jgi:hypothetical protein
VRVLLELSVQFHAHPLTAAALNFIRRNRARAHLMDLELADAHCTLLVRAALAQTATQASYTLECSEAAAGS